MPFNSNRKRLATAYARAADLPYQSALARVVDLQGFGIKLSCRNAAALQRSVQVLQDFYENDSSIEPGAAQAVPSVPVPPYSQDAQRIVLGNSEDGHEVRLGDQDASTYHRYPTVLVAGRPGSGKTTLMLQIAHQQRRLDERVTYLSFRRDRTIADELSGTGMDHVALTPALLQQSPGALDPMLFSDRFTRAGDILTAAIANLLRLRHHDGGRDQFLQWALLQREIQEGARDLRNASASDVIFGNGATESDERTTGISNLDIRHQLQSANSTFSHAVLGSSQAGKDLGKLIRSGNVLMQWSDDWGFADPVKASQNMTDKEMESESCALAAFLLVADSAGERGGTFIVEDFDSALSRCLDAHHMMVEVGRGYRLTNVMPVIGVQSLTAIDLGEGGLLKTCDRMVLMRLNSNAPGEVEALSRLTGLPAAEYHRWADLNPRLAPGLGYYVDRVRDWQGMLMVEPLRA